MVVLLFERQRRREALATLRVERDHSERMMNMKMTVDCIDDFTAGTRSLIVVVVVLVETRARESSEACMHEGAWTSK